MNTFFRFIINIFVLISFKHIFIWEAGRLLKKTTIVFFSVVPAKSFRPETTIRFQKQRNVFDLGSLSTVKMKI